MSSTFGQLSPSFYAQSCPGVELAVRDVVRSASTLDPSIPGKLLRLVFHDCFVEVWNGLSVSESLRLGGK
jgi:peroxidase